MNIAAEDLRAVAYLAPDLSRAAELDGSYLFPEPSEDGFYAELLERRERALADRTAALDLYRHLQILHG